MKALYYKSRTANIAGTGILRLANNSDTVSWRNAANNADLPLTVNASNQLLYNGVPVLTGSGPSSYVSSITGTANQVVASASTGAVTLSLPQSVDTAAVVQFGTLALGSTLDTSSILSLSSTTKGFLPPIMTTTQRNAISTPTNGLIVYDSSLAQLYLRTGGSWTSLSTGGGSGTVASGTQYQLGYYASTGTTLSGNSSIFTDASNNFYASVAAYIGASAVARGKLTVYEATSNTTLNTTISYDRSNAANSNGSGLEIINRNVSTANTGWRFSVDGDGVLQFVYLGGSPFVGTTNAVSFTTSGIARLGNGSVSAPAITFGDTGSGLYKTFLNHIGVTLNGTNVIDFQPTDTIFSNRLNGPDGSASSVSYTFSSGTQNTGMYKPGTNQLGFATGGTLALTLDGSQKAIHNGNISFTTTSTQGIVGTTTNDSAAAGNVGESVRSSITTSTNYPATATWGDLTSISLTAGDWLVTGVLAHQGNSSTCTSALIGISTTTGNSATGLQAGDNESGDNTASAASAQILSTSSGFTTFTIPSYRMSLASTTTVYLKYRATYSAGTPQALGTIRAVRIR